MHLQEPSRSQTSPFIVSAPGKVILYGEHAVVHGRAAIAAAISLRSYLHVCQLPVSAKSVSVRFLDIGLDHSWEIATLPWSACQHSSRDKHAASSFNQELADALEPHVVMLSRKAHRTTARAFLYLYMALSSKTDPPCVYALRSSIPIGAGLGSSASICVCISGALLAQRRGRTASVRYESSDMLGEIISWAFLGEKIIHGNPSGVDNTVAGQGRAVQFRRQAGDKPRVSNLTSFPELPMLLIDTHHTRSTAAEVAKVERLTDTCPLLAERIFDAIDIATQEAHRVICGDDASSTKSVQKLGELVDINHGLLISLGVSHPRIERIRQVLGESQCGWTKLTGAGGGGCAITLLKPEISDPKGFSTNAPDASALRTAEDRLVDEGYKIHQVTIGVHGVGIFSPVTADNKYLDTKAFLDISGESRIETLMETIQCRNAWRYW